MIDQFEGKMAERHHKHAGLKKSFVGSLFIVFKPVI